jgi:hypothetical protein
VRSLATSTLTEATCGCLFMKGEILNLVRYSGNAARLNFRRPLVRTKPPDRFSNKAVHKATHLLGYILSRQSPNETRDLDAEQSSFVCLCQDHAYQIRQTHIRFVFPLQHNIKMLNRIKFNYRTFIYVYKLQEYSFQCCGAMESFPYLYH